MKIEVPEPAKIILNKLIKANFVAYLVGGTVRNLIIEKLYPEKKIDDKKNDFDIATSANTDQIKKVFRKYSKYEPGIKFGTISVIHKKNTFDITTFRTESNYQDGRRPENIRFIKDIKQDLSRRDLTINSIALNENGKLIDPNGGEQDIRDELIRTVGNPDTRFTEDYLRMLRAIRFAIRFNFKIEEKTLNSIKKNAPQIIQAKVSEERIFTEINKMLKINHKLTIANLIQSNLFKVLLPEIYNKLHLTFKNETEIIEYYNQEQFTQKKVEELWTYLLHPIANNENKVNILKVINRFKGIKKQERKIYPKSNRTYKSDNRTVNST